MDIWLHLDTHGITQQQWETVWDECCEVLEYFPVPLASFFVEEKWGTKCWVLKPQIKHSEGDKAFICINTDMASLVVGESYILKRNINEYHASTKYRDILWKDEKEIDHHYGRMNIWENKTGGAPYALAVLALGILIENRFPNNCFMNGYYDESQVENMCAWLAGVLKTNVRLPVCNDPKRLWKRIQPLYPDINLMIRRFCGLANVSKKQCYEFLITQGYGEALQDCLINQMSRYSSVDQWGVTDMLFPYLEATNDVEHVALLVKQVHEKNGKEGFSLETLLESLLYQGVTINPMQSEIVKKWNETGDRLETSVEELNRLILRMGGLPNRINFYISPDNLLEIFGCMEPVNGVKFQKIINRETKKRMKEYQKMADFSDKMVEQLSNTDEPPPSNKTEIMSCWVRRRYLPFEDYILREVEEQVKTFRDIEKVTHSIAEQLGKVMKMYDDTYGTPYKPKSREKALKDLSSLINERGFVLREITWETIGNEPDLDILTMLILYAGVRESEKKRFDLRSYVFETPALWPAMRDTFLKAAK